MTLANDPTPTSRRHPRRVIWFCDTDLVAAHPEWLARLRDEIGLTTLMAEDFVHHTSGFAADPEIAGRSPLRHWRERPAELEQHLGAARVAAGVYPVVPGILGGVDDGNLRRLLDAAGAAGIEVWGHIGLWSYAGEVFPEFSMRDVWGQPPDVRYQRWGIGFCPSKGAINEWVAAGLADVTRRYDVAGFMVDHARYPAPASVSALFGCACPDCAAAGRRLGYDVDAIYAAVRDLPDRLAALTPTAVERAARAHPSFVDWLSWLGGDAKEIVAWLQLRCHLLAQEMATFGQVVRTARDAPGAVPAPPAARDARVIWGSDVFPPSVALFGGHDYALWQQGADYLTGGASHGGVVGWATAITYAALEWSRYLCQRVPDLEAATALRLMFRLLGQDDLLPRSDGAAPVLAAGAISGHLPLAFAPLERGDAPVLEIMEGELARLVAGAPASLALYPPISAGRASAPLGALCRAVAGAGVHGALLSGLDADDDAQLRTIRDGLGALARP